MALMDDCIFCKIVKGEIPSAKIYEDERFLAFLDIKPVSEGHVLVIPKEHVIWMQDADEETISGIFNLAKKLMRKIKKGLKCDSVTLSVVGVDIPHFHVHLIPRYLNDNLASWPAKEYKGGEIKKVAERISRAL